MEHESISEILKGTSDVKTEGKPSEAAPSAAEPVKAEAKPEAKIVRDEKGKFTKPESKPEATDAKVDAKAVDTKSEVKPDAKPDAKKDRMDSAQIAAVLDERRKRQALEAELKTLKEGKPKTDFYENPEKAFEEKLSEATNPLKEKYFKLSLKVAQRLHDDYEAAANAFAEAAEKDDRLIQQMRDHEDPGEFIYAIGKQIQELSDVGGDIVKYREKVTAESQKQLTEANERIKALEAEVTALKASQADLDNLPRSLNKAPSGPSPKSGGEDPESIKSIVRFGGQKG